MEFIVNNVYLPIEKDESELPSIVCNMLKIKRENFVSYKLIKKSVDSRDKKHILFVYSLLVTLNYYYESIKTNVNVRKNNLIERIEVPKLTKVRRRPVVIGFGPCGMFAALLLARANLKPIIVERGKMVDDRIIDVNNFKENGVLDLNSNFCFGEGGAGTFSDGKLNTGINDDRIKFVLKEMINHGAPEEIYYQNHPHVGSDNLVNVVKNIREEIKSLGGKFLFETTFKDYIEDDEGYLKGIIVSTGQKDEKIINCEHAILAIGHSARDTFTNLYRHNLKMKPKAFSIGVRIEHSQEELDKGQYGKEYQNEKLPRSDYKQVVHLDNGRTVYTFCMCPGGEVVGTPTEEKTIVTNGMSYYRRDLSNCNSALLVNINVEDFYVNSPLDGMYLQEVLEREAYDERFPYKAPCQKVGDFLLNRESTSFGHIRPSYRPGVYFRKMSDILPGYVNDSLKLAIPEIAKKLKIFKDPDALITGIETRSSSPISIPRDADYSSSVKNLYPAGEGASYAGGIMSSALDGTKIALKIIEKYQGK